MFYHVWQIVYIKRNGMKWPSKSAVEKENRGFTSYCT